MSGARAITHLMMEVEAHYETSGLLEFQAGTASRSVSYETLVRHRCSTARVLENTSYNFKRLTVKSDKFYSTTRYDDFLNESRFISYLGRTINSLILVYKVKGLKDKSSPLC